MKTLNQEQEEKLKEVLSYMVNLSIAREKDNYSTCGSFHIEPFNTHWDKKTVKEVNYHVRLYIDIWVIPKLEQILNIKRSTIERERRKKYKEARIRYKEWMNKKSK